MAYDPFRSGWDASVARPTERPRSSLPESNIRDFFQGGTAVAPTAADPTAPAAPGLPGAPTVTPPDSGYIDAGNNNRPYQGVGRSNVGAFFTPPTGQDMNPGDTPPSYEGGMGFFEALGALPGSMVSQVLPDVGKPIADIGRMLGGILETPFRSIRPLEGLPGGQDVTTAFNMLPYSSEKAAFLKALQDDPLHREQFMLQYVRLHANDLASLQGVARPFGQFNAPTGSLSEQLTSVVFGGLSAGQMAVGRTLTGLRPLKQEILDADITKLPPQVAELRRRFEAGEITWNQLLDDLSGTAYKYTFDDGVTGALMTLGLDIFTDPLTWATMGTGAAIKSATSASARLASSVRIAAERIAPDVLEAATKQAWTGLESEAVLKGLLAPTGEVTQRVLQRQVTDIIKTTRPDIYEAGLNGVSRSDRAWTAIEPRLHGIEQTVDRVQNPYAWFGVDRAARVFQSRMSRATPRGFIQAYGAPRIGAIASTFDSVGMGPEFDRYLAVAASNVGMLTHVRSLVRDLVNSGKEPTKASPMDFIRARQEGASGQYAKTIEQEVEHVTRGVMKDPLPSGSVGQAAIDTSVTAMRERAAGQMALMTGKTIDEARVWVKGMDTTSLAAVDHVHYGYAIETMLKAREAAIGAATKSVNVARAKAASAKNPKSLASANKAIAKAEEHLRNVTRYTLISERAMTSAKAKELVRALKNKGTSAATARQAIKDFDLIAANFDRKALSDEQLVEEMLALVSDLLVNEKKRLPQTVPVAKLEPDVRVWLQEQERVLGTSAYQVALSPEDAWGISSRADGTILGSHLWVDATADGATSWRPSRMDKWKMRYAVPIRGSRLLMEARQRFKEIGVRDGLTRGQSEALFESLRKAASDTRVGPRGLDPSRMMELATSVGIEKATLDALGERGLAKMLAWAYEGDIRTVGLTTKMSGEFKTFTARSGNWAARIAEDIYPKARFLLSPFFVAQEWVEGPFFNLLRGIKPGVRWTVEDRLFQELLDGFRNTADSYTDQTEYIQLVAATHMEVRRTMGPGTRAGRVLSEMPGGFTNLRSVKQLNYYRMGMHEAAEAWYQSIVDIDPRLWSKWVDEYKTTDKRQLMLRFFAERGGLSDDSRAVLRKMDAYKPADLGAGARIHMSDLAAEFSHESGDKLRETIRNKSLDEATFRSTLVANGADPTYISRAWAVASGHSVDEMSAVIEQQLRERGVEPSVAKLGADAFKANATARARTLQMPVDEYLAKHYGGLPVGMTAGTVLPAGSFTQTFREYAEQNAMLYIAKTGDHIERFHSIQAIQRGMVTEMAEGAKAMHGKDVVNAQKRHAKGPTNKKAMQWPKSNTIVTGDNMSVSFGDLSKEHFAKWLDTSLTPEQLTEYSQWYDHMTTLWAGLVSKLPDGVLKRLEGHYKAKGKTFATIEDLQDDLSARLLVAFSVTQQNTSVREGFSFVMRMLAHLEDGMDELEVRGRIGSLGVVKRRIDSLLIDLLNVPPGEFAQKLVDFADASSGKLTRSLTEGLEGADQTLQPAAIDIWMKRAFGYMDTAYEDYLAVRMVQTNKATSLPEARLLIAKQLGYEPGSLKGPEAPSKFEYEVILKRVNEVKDHFNDRSVFPHGFGGSEGNERVWAATDVQAAIWMAQQKNVGYPDTSPSSLFVSGGYTVPTEVGTPGDGSYFSRDLPSLVNLPEDVQQRITRDIEDVVAPIVGNLSGSIEVTRLPSVGGWQSKVNPNWVSVIVGDWEQVQVASLVRAYLTQQEEIFATALPHPMEVNEKNVLKSDPYGTSPVKDADGNVIDRAPKPRFWGLDFQMPLDAKASEMPMVIRYMHEIMPSYEKDKGWSGSMSAQTDEGIYVGRAVYMQEEMTGKGGKRKANQLTLEDFQKRYSFTPEQVKEMESGQWVFAKKEDGSPKYPGADRPMPLTVKPQLHRVFQVSNKVYKEQHEALLAKVRSDMTHEEAWPQTYGRVYLDMLEQMGHGDIVKRLTGGKQPDGTMVRGYAHEVRDFTYDAYARHTGGTAADLHQRARQLGDGHTEATPNGYTGSVYHQRAADTGRIRGAMSFDSENRGTLYLGQRPDVSTIVHETFHSFARDLDPSGTQALLDAYVAAKNVERAAKGLLPMRRQTRWTVTAEEWAAAEFEKYVASGEAPTPMLQGLFNQYGAWGAAVGIGKSNPAANAVFAKFTDTPDSERFTFNADEQRWWGAARYAVMKGEEQAHSTHYYRRGRTWVERSANHPYLGLYPASYMWGKVLPEMLRFLVQRPFGLKAPLGGLAMATTAYNSLQQQFQTDGDLTKFVDSHPDTVRMASLMTPGVPWDIPVGLPLFARRAQETMLENQQRLAEGKTTKSFDPFGTISDSITYSNAYGQNIMDIGNILGEFLPPGQNPAFGGPTARPTKMSGETEAAYLARVATYNAANPAQSGATMAPPVTAP